MGQPHFKSTPVVSEIHRSPRRVFRRPIGCLYRGTYTVAHALQLGEGGLLFVSPWVLSPGDQVALTLMLPGGGSFVVRAEIAYAAKGQKAAYGVRFNELSMPLRRLIRTYVSAKTQAEASAENRTEK